MQTFSYEWTFPIPTMKVFPLECFAVYSIAIALKGKPTCACMDSKACKLISYST